MITYFHTVRKDLEDRTARKDLEDDEVLLNCDDKKTIKLLACVKFLYPDINKKISDPEMYVILFDWLNSIRYIYFHGCSYLQPLSCKWIVKYFSKSLDGITANGKNSKKIKNLLNKSNNTSFIPANRRSITTIANVACKRQMIFKLASVRLSKITKKNNIDEIITLLQDQSVKTPTLMPKSIDSYTSTYNSLQKEIDKQLKQITIKNKDDIKNICDELDGKKVNNNEININNKEKESENNVNQTNINNEENNLNNIIKENNNININEDNNFDKTSNIINEEQRTNLIKENNNEIKEEKQEENSNETKPQNNDGNKGPIPEGYNEGKKINNDEAENGCWCKGCSCNIWPFN